MLWPQPQHHSRLDMRLRLGRGSQHVVAGEGCAHAEYVRGRGSVPAR
jgi:hypothetical protein